MQDLKIVRGTFSFFLSTITLILIFLLFTAFSEFRVEKTFAASNSEENLSTSLERGMYVIIGAFQFPENATRYAHSVKVDGKTPKIARNPENGLFYVIGYSAQDDLQFARAKRAELRATSQFYDAWILYVGLSLEELLAREAYDDTDDDPDQMVASQLVEAYEQEAEEELIPPPPVPESLGVDTYKYLFSVVNGTNMREVPGYVTIVDAARNKTLKSVSTNEVHELQAPNSVNKEILAICDIFGYVKDQVNVKIDDPMNSEDQTRISQANNVTTIQFELFRHKVGDILTMYNVYFFSNSAIMKPESKFELNSLLDMLKENDKLEIRIHGHTNGNAAGKIIKLNKDDTNFFEITDNNDVGVASAKELSRERAEVIQRWLIEHGIDQKRMQLKGWGGKKMLYGKTDAMAGKNVRVEIEILKG